MFLKTTLGMGLIVFALVFASFHPSGPFPPMPPELIDVSTDKPVYDVGEGVKILTTNIYNSTIGFPTPPCMSIYTIDGDVVHKCGEVVIQLAITLEPGESYNVTWDQEYGYGSPLRGQKVPEGHYRVWVSHEYCGYDDNVIPCADSTVLEIRQAEEGPVADAGPDQTVNEGDVVQFNGTDSYGGGELSFNLTEPIRINNVTTLDQLSMSMAIDSKGHIFIVWTDGRTIDRCDIYLARSVDGGESFGENVRVAEVVPYGGRHTSIAHVPDIAVDSQDNIYIVWRNVSGMMDNWSVMMSRSFDGGQTFEEKKPVNEPYLAARSIPSVAVGKNDTVYVAWHEVAPRLGHGSRVCVAKSEDGGETFGPCVLANTPGHASSKGAFEMTTVEADPDDHVYASWFSSWGYLGDDIFVSSSEDGGESFGNPKRVNERKEGEREVWPVMAVGPEGYVYVAWLDSRNKGPDCSFFCDVYFSRSTDYGSTFDPNVRVSNASAENFLYLPAMALDPNGNPYVSWSSFPGSSIYLDRSLDKGETFGSDVELLRNWSDDFNHMGAMAFSSDGVLHLTFNRRHSEDPWLESRDVYYSRTLTSLTETNLTYEWDFDASADINGNGNFTDDIGGTGPTPTWVYGDDGNFIVTLKVTDELGNWDTDTMNVTVLNVPPKTTVNYTCAGGGLADILLRIAGEKWHDVSFTIYEDDSEIYNETVTRVPGSPNEQMIGLEDFKLNAFHSYSAAARYSPDDDRVNGQPNGATPAWIILKSGGKEIARLHHTFNVKHPDTWIWRVDDLSSYFPERECTFTAYISDPGSDDLNITWDWGDGTTIEHIYYNDGVGPDPYPSPDVNPITVTDIATHSYASAEIYTITLTVRDDDGGVVTQTLVLDLS